MDPRQSLARTNSAALPQTSFNHNMATYAMPQYSNAHLPPIQSPYPPPMHQNQNYMPQYRPELPRYPSAPNPSQPSDRYNSHITNQSPMAGLPPTSMLPQPNGQHQQQQHYPNPASAAPNYQQRIAPAPPRPTLESLATSYTHPQDRPPMWSSGEQMPSITTDAGRDPTRLHVVGSQGRRGILPSDPGRGPPNGMNGQPKSNAVPQKDQDGKYPCPNCNKTYLHAKHLKRHMLRHTGDRPYMCVLCNDTFSRSDILKRHFQKCSVRRGNPTGASHLSNPAAHLKKSREAAAKAATDSPSSTTTPSTATHPNPPFTSASMGAGSIPTTSAAYADSASVSYAMPNTSAGEMQRPAPTQTMPGTNGQNGDGPSWPMRDSRNTLLYQPNSGSPDHFAEKRHAMQPSQHMGDEWNQGFYQSGNNDYMNQMFQPYDQSHHPAKKEYDGGAENSSNYYISSNGLGPDGMLAPPPWSMDASQEDPLQLTAERPVDFCFPAGIQESLQEQQNSFPIRSCLTPQSIKHFLALFNHFQSHFAYLHLGTFNVLHAYDGLVLVIICIGAAYSTVPQSQVRDLMARTKSGIERTSSLRNSSRSSKISSSGPEFQELQALLMLLTLTIWHGGPEQRAAARAESIQLFRLVRSLDLLQLASQSDPDSFSYLHHLPPSTPPDPLQWSWQLWVEQEKRSRLVYLVFLLDAALVVYFNCTAQFSASEIHVPLPCDDAAWDAETAEKCAQALGLYGHQLQQSTNPCGSWQYTQPSLSDVMSVLHDPGAVLIPRSTNIYSKFITIHALLVEVCQVQCQRSIAGLSNLPSPSNATQSPGSLSQANSFFRSISGAIVRWKRGWDEDMQLQYPPTMYTNLTSRRFGFCRDGVHFYWLSRAFLEPNRVHDWRIPSDARFQQAMSGLKKAREWSRTDGARRGEEPGSVYDMDDDYGVQGLELDMKKLFRPIG